MPCSSESPRFFIFLLVRLLIWRLTHACMTRPCAPSGQTRHVCHLPVQWKSYLDTDLAVPGHGPGRRAATTTLADVVSGAALGAATKRHVFAGTAAVSNLGDDPTWTGHEFSAANTYGYGRLAWNPGAATST